MRELIKKISNLESPVILTESELNKCLKQKEKKILIGLKILLKTKPLNQIICPECQDHFIEIQCQNKKYFGYCNKDDIGKISVLEKDIICWQIDINNLLSLFIKNITSDQAEIKENIKNILWNLGKHEINNRSYNLFFTKDIKLLDDKAEALLAVNKPALLFINYADNGLSQNLKLIPVLDLIKGINKTGFIIDPEELDYNFPEDIIVDDENDLFLDKHIVVSEQNNKLYLTKLAKGKYKNTIKISPQSAKIISLLHQIKDYSENTRTHQSLAKSFCSNSTKSLSNKIKEIKDICTKNKVKNILHKNSKQEWSLNPELDCFKDN